ncbi:c-type cytochrome [Lichenicoccus roseus]|uniref:C-type cytochrome n=1 Tax=Lichenicoccus roseus TaxID=2683649 RepID=A0A5R9JBY5_9PROT|nr:c-type cytochrome [Lichenicoccus roseus]TLU72896.1 c-type cytochrome [Lichenicoccus roseus]
MDSTELNKIMAAFLTAGIVFGLGGVLGGKLIHSPRPEHPAFAIVSALPEGVSAAPREVPIAALLAHADPAKGQSDAAKLCGACHSFNKGGATMVGPNLYNVVMAPIAEGDGYDFSAGLKAHHGKWTFDDMSAWLKDPKAYAPGTKMAFAGIANGRQRADVVDYLRTLSDSPQPLPPVPKEAPAAAATAAAGSAPAAPAGPSFAEEVGHADPKLGEAAAGRYCGACHSFDQGGAALVGPNLYNVVDRAIAAAPGYSYSAALTAKHAAWTYANLNAWLTDPRGYAPGNKMGFAGIPSEKQRAAVVAYLRSLSPNPHPISGAGAGGADKPGQGAHK